MPKKTYYRTSLILLILSTIIMVLTWLSDLSQTNKLIIIVIVGIILSWYVQYFFQASNRW
ncbi:cytochrome aa3 quinol oxidase, subunit IV, qoxD [Pediococcus acidilactici]|uniref:cytochrome aa3 quinol oxidase, subunit IV, qoxD n=1 Tax=Pediococcus acidilactici TaxID=1254 RepID=UPI00190F52A7|nr:cytochrome aa3 quinol oxidase, subunit IV, qoxD [Pediococcus acidilactici]